MKPVACPLYYMKTGSQRGFGICCQAGGMTWGRHPGQDPKQERDDFFNGCCNDLYKACGRYMEYMTRPKNRG